MINIKNATTLERVYIYIYIENFIKRRTFNKVPNVMFTNKCKQGGKNYIVQQSDTHTQVVLNNIFFKIRIRRNKDPCCGLRLLYLRI